MLIVLDLKKGKIGYFPILANLWFKNLISRLNKVLLPTNKFMSLMDNSYKIIFPFNIMEFSLIIHYISFLDYLAARIF